MKYYTWNWYSSNTIHMHKSVKHSYLKDKDWMARNDISTSFYKCKEIAIRDLENRIDELLDNLDQIRNMKISDVLEGDRGI